jgi:hypothetical protein
MINMSEKIMIGLLALFFGFGFLIFGHQTKTMNAELQQLKSVVSELKTDDTAYKYVISEVNGDEINGLAITLKSEDNGGIVLSKQYNNVDLKVGDIIEVTYGKEFDEILDVKVIK